MNRPEKNLKQMNDRDDSAHIESNQQHIAEAAYYKAEKRGFEPGFEEQDWAEAENEMESRVEAATPSVHAAIRDDLR